jgi:hypothetical protein
MSRQMMHAGVDLERADMSKGMEAVRQGGPEMQQFFYELLPLIIAREGQKHGIHFMMEGRGGLQNRQLLGFYLAGLYSQVQGWSSSFGSPTGGAVSASSSKPVEEAEEAEEADEAEEEEEETEGMIPSPVDQMPVPGGKTETET